MVAEVDSIIESHKESVGITASSSDDVSSPFESDERKKKLQFSDDSSPVWHQYE